MLPAFFYAFLNMKIPSEQAIIQGIREHNTAILEFVYHTYFPVIEGFVIHHQGNREHAKDVFQEAMIVVYNRIRSHELVLSCKFGTYLYAVCRNIWIQERKKFLLHTEKLKNRPMVVHDSGPEADPLLQEHLTSIFEKHFKALSPDCQKILQMDFSHYSVEEIRSAMNYKDIHHASDRKYRCKKSLIKRILNDPLYKQLNNEER